MYENVLSVMCDGNQTQSFQTIVFLLHCAISCPVGWSLGQLRRVWCYTEYIWVNCILCVWLWGRPFPPVPVFRSSLTPVFRLWLLLLLAWCQALTGPRTESFQIPFDSSVYLEESGLCLFPVVKSRSPDFFNDPNSQYFNHTLINKVFFFRFIVCQVV